MIPSGIETKMVRINFKCTSAKYMVVPGNLWEDLEVVRPESQGSQLAEVYGPMRCPLGPTESVTKRCQQSYTLSKLCQDHIRALATTLERPWIIVDQSGNINTIFWIVTGAHWNYCYDILFNDFSTTCIWFLFPSLYPGMYIATHLHKVYMDWMQVVLESNWRLACRRQPCELRGTVRCHYGMNLQMHLEAILEWLWRYAGRLRSSYSKLHLEAVIKWVWGCWWRPWSCEP